MCLAFNVYRLVLQSTYRFPSGGCRKERRKPMYCISLLLDFRDETFPDTLVLEVEFMCLLKPLANQNIPSFWILDKVSDFVVSRNGKPLCRRPKTWIRCRLFHPCQIKNRAFQVHGLVCSTVMKSGFLFQTAIFSSLLELNTIPCTKSSIFSNKKGIQYHAQPVATGSLKKCILERRQGMRVFLHLVTVNCDTGL